MKENSKSQFEELYQKYERYIHNLLFKFTRDIDTTEDLKQESFLRIFQSFDSFDPEKGSFSAWASTIARNIFFRYVENSKKNANTVYSEEIISQIGDNSLNPEFTFQKKNIREEIKNLISCLSEPEKSIVIFKYQNNLTLDEIAAKLAISRRTVSRKYITAMTKIKEEAIKKNLEL
ncbi:MAG TPA: sigma-70 family RNA polymerase sigma factor [Leptospiraceae bacterium]|nr:sigma-70 family RNA polymerase sigma factor [Leptospiraceae bacterium]HMW06043.1 sigma-70 family RNA polymerase sigma factor [Leptospiraceae bacterium]HMX35302.1 sigma-70 family RNA polymerase sigma factor [Leptospiraceae bacterium]HMY31415.1 sigma-70 family RNA polymerase sigma factor [Leptospiraceae bacterium]HNA07470.1 sigma-70 family RNA polymerase sigma factor [Leptospiraceae bacterium]